MLTAVEYAATLDLCFFVCLFVCLSWATVVTLWLWHELNEHLKSWTESDKHKKCPVLELKPVKLFNVLLTACFMLNWFGLL